MDQGHNVPEENNHEISLETVCDQYKMFLEYIYSLKPSLLKTQLSELLYPLYVHLFLYLLDKNKTAEHARGFLEKFRFVAHTKPQEIKILQSSSTSRAVVRNHYFNRYRKPIHVRYTASNYDHLQKWLEVNQPFLISRLLKENFHPEILNKRVGKADPLHHALQSCGNTDKPVNVNNSNHLTRSSALVGLIKFGSYDVISLKHEPLLKSFAKIDSECVIAGNVKSNGFLERNKPKSSLKCKDTIPEDITSKDNSNGEDTSFNSLKTKLIEDSKSKVCSTEPSFNSDSEYPEPCQDSLMESLNFYDGPFELKLQPDKNASFTLKKNKQLFEVKVQKKHFNLDKSDYSYVKDYTKQFSLFLPSTSQLEKTAPEASTVKTQDDESFTLEKNKRLFEIMVQTKHLNCSMLLPSNNQSEKIISEASTIETQGNLRKSKLFRNIVLRPKINMSKYIYARYLNSVKNRPSLSSNKQSSNKQSTNKQFNNLSKAGTTNSQGLGISLPKSKVLYENKVTKAKSNYARTWNSVKRQALLLPANNQCKKISVPSSSKASGTSFTFNNSKLLLHNKVSKSTSAKPIRNHTLNCAKKPSQLTHAQCKTSSETRTNAQDACFTLKKCLQVPIHNQAITLPKTSTVIVKDSSFTFEKCKKLLNKKLSSTLNVDNFCTPVCSLTKQHSHQLLSNNIVKAPSETDTSKTKRKIQLEKNESTRFICKSTTNLTTIPILLAKKEPDTANMSPPNLSNKTDQSTSNGPRLSLLAQKYLSESFASVSEEINENDKLLMKKVSKKYNTQTSESSLRKVVLPPIRVLNIECDQVLRCSVVSPNLSYVACGFENSLYLWKPKKNFPKKYFTSLTTEQMDLCKRNVFVSRNRRISGVPAASGSSFPCHCLAPNPATNTFMLGSESIIESWCPVQNKCLTSYNCHTGAVHNICLKSNSTDFVSSSEDKRAIVWDFEYSIPKCIYSHEAAVKLATFHPKSHYLVTATSRKIYIWTEENCRRPPRVCNSHKADITGIAFSVNGDHLASCDKSGLVYIWDMKIGRRFNFFTVPNTGVKDMSYNFSVENSILAIAGNDNYLRLYDDGKSESNAHTKFPFFSAQHTRASTLSSINFSHENELIQVTYTSKKPYQVSPGPLSCQV